MRLDGLIQIILLWAQKYDFKFRLRNLKPLKIPNGTIILKLNSKREINSEIDLDQEIRKQLIYEKNRQLKSFSLNYYTR